MFNYYKNLVWYLNITVFSAFHDLQFLDLSQNYQTSLNFDGLVGLTKLRFLYLGGNGLEGNFPSSLGNLVSLEVMDFSYNVVNGTLPVVAFENLSNLRELNLSYSMFEGRMESLFALPHLKVLDFSGNELSEGGFPVPPQPILLEVLSLSDTAMNGTLPSSAFKNLRNLRRLDLSFNGFHGSVPASLFSLPHLNVLDLSGNYFQGGIPINSSLGKISLEVLNLDDNQLKGTRQIEQGTKMSMCLSCRCKYY